jgi:hypothetical protein
MPVVADGARDLVAAVDQRRSAKQFFVHNGAHGLLSSSQQRLNKTIMAVRPAGKLSQSSLTVHEFFPFIPAYFWQCPR